MKRLTVFVFPLLLVFVISMGLNSVLPTPAMAQTNWPKITKETRPWARWWWMGSAVDENNLVRLMAQYNSAGFGGLEVTPIYGAVGFEPKYLPYLSSEWMKMLDVSVREANKNNMGIDMNLGTGWPFGGPQVTPQVAASKLVIQKYNLKNGEKLNVKIVPTDPQQVKVGVQLQAVTAYNTNGQTKDLTALTDGLGTLNWTATDGDWEIYAAFCGKTLQKVKRAAPGGEGLTFDHFSKDGLTTYLARFDSAFKDSNHGVNTFFNDSYEVYGTNWTASLFDEYLKRRGYALQPYLRELAEKKATTDLSRRVQCDYRETISDLLHDNFLSNWTKWANQKGSLSRNQAHGSPGNLLDLYAAADIPECETFGSSYFPIPGLRRDSADIRNVDPDPVMMKFASSAANVSGKKLTSCETFTWLGEHFRVSLSQCKPEVEQAFLSGVNRGFYHGLAYSPAEASWPGWLFYASVNFAPSNSFFPHLRGLNDYIALCQSVLQSGAPHNDLLVYWPVYDVWMEQVSPDMMLAIHGIDKWLYPTPFCKDVKEWMTQGYSLDFVSDKLLNNLSIKENQLLTKSGASYRTLVIPASGYMPETTLQKIIDMAAKGALVIFQQFPQDVPGNNKLEDRRILLKKIIKDIQLTTVSGNVKSAKIGKGEIILAENVQEALDLKKISNEKLVDSGLKYIRRKTDKGVYYYLVNHSPNAIDDYLPINEKATECLLLDPQSGATGLAQTQVLNGSTKVHLQLQSGEAMFVLASPTKIKTGNWEYLEKKQIPVELAGPWKLAFKEGGAKIPSAKELTKLVSWTELTDPDAQNFSGTAIYTTTFELKGNLSGEYLLDLGKVCESARVFVNDQEVGILWNIPFAARIKKFLKPGQNTITIEVANLMANRIRQMDQNKEQWRNYHEINFVNIDYKPFDASGWKPMASGLLGPVTITQYN